MLKLLKKDPYIISVVLLGLLAGWWLLRPGYFNMHDDLQMMRQLAMEECFRDFQIPCRWTPHMGYGFGFPLFNYYPPLPYLVGELFRLVGFSFITTAKLTFLLSFILSGVTMYILGRELWGKTGGLLAAAFYIWAPYHSLDVFVRGAMNEAWGLIWFPLILWSAYKLIQESKFKYMIILALSWFALLTSHNLMVIIFAPLFSLWCLMWLTRFKAWGRIPQLILSGVWAAGLAAFFTLPVFLEKNLVHVETLVVGYYEYVAHFANIRQLLFSRFWGYGASAWMDDDKMAFPVGHLHWILSLVVGTFVLWRLIKTKKLDNPSLIACFFLAAGWFATFMAHSRSTPIWQMIPPLKFVQFPWRFLTLVILSFSLLIGSLPTLPVFKKFNSKLLVGILIFGVVAWNWEFFKPEKMGTLTDKEKFSNAAWDLQQTAGIYDYLPKDAWTAPKKPRERLLDIITGKGLLLEESQKTNSARAKIRMDEEGDVRVNIFKFPGWKVFIDGKETQVFIHEKEEWGRMYIKIPQGEHEVAAKLTNTPVRTAGNTISLLTWLGTLTLPFWRGKKLLA